MVRTAVVLAMLLSAADTPAGAPAADELTKTVTALAQRMASNASQMHPERNADLIPDTDQVVYVSFGSPITGKEYVKTLTASYAQRKSLNHVWTKWEVTPISANAAVFTGWATISEESLAGDKKTQHVIFTEVFAKTTAGWKRVIAQKSLLDEE